MADNKVLLRATDIDKQFGITHAVDHVSIDFYSHEIHALIGENGSGKSTFTNMLTGIYTLGGGTFALEDKTIFVKNQVSANRLGIAIIVQEMGTLSGLTVAENIFLGEEDPFIHNGVKNTAAMNKKAQDLLDSYGFSRIRANAIIDTYNFEDRKLVEIVKSTYFDPKVLVVDETTTALNHSGRVELFKHMRRLRDLGSCVIFISHDLDEVLEMSDRVSVLRDGEYIDTVNAKDVTTDDLKKLMVGRELGEHYYRTDYGEKIPEEVALKVENVSVGNEIHNVSFELHKGEILGIGGLSECGMHEVGKACFGASFDRTGSVTLADGTQINDINTAINHSIAYASKDRDNESLLINDSIMDNITLPSMRDMGKVLSIKKLHAFADKFAKEMSTKMVNVDQFVSELSGGNKQKVVLARWIGKGSDILILDSPTRGIDIKVKADIYALMDKMRKEGKSILMISEELPELMGMSDRILIMKEGEISGEFLRDPSITDTALIEKMI